MNRILDRLLNRIPIVVALVMLCAAPSGEAAETGPSRYAGEEARPVKSLSPDDIEELTRGGGWGLARAAELNGMPGPAHLLELKDALALTPGQVDAIIAIHERMREAAIAEGERFIEAERALEDAFRSHSVTEASLERMLVDIERSRARLRFIHLKAHLGTPELLTKGQIARYAALRGYHALRGGARPARRSRGHGRLSRVAGEGSGAGRIPFGYEGAPSRQDNRLFQGRLSQRAGEPRPAHPERDPRQAVRRTSAGC